MTDDVRVCADCKLGSPMLREGLCYHCYPAYLERQAAAAHRAKAGVDKPAWPPPWYDRVKRVGQTDG